MNVVFITKDPDKYHENLGCIGPALHRKAISREEAEAAGIDPCGKCVKMKVQ